MCFTELRFHALSMTGAVAETPGRWVVPFSADAEDPALEITDGRQLVALLGCEDLEQIAHAWSFDGGSPYLHPVIVSAQGHLFGGFIDTAIQALVIQVDAKTRRRDAIRTAFHAALVRSQGDRAGVNLPMTLYPGALDALTDRLARASADNQPAHEAGAVRYAA